MPRKNSNARQRVQNKKIKIKPDFFVEVDIPSKPWRQMDDISPGYVVARGEFKIIEKI
ncbi:hypothetical protein [Dehalobacterium formicoaceticum]|uniref:hypothetical protein n=1 Tax=Dehalobacterium formicoaceticum TaxID=51515 RepID=UPI0012F98304|nr:hypothetical protein [Dehalobacterium formicoaceticum]